MTPPRTSLFALSFSAGLIALSLNGSSSLPRNPVAGTNAPNPANGATADVPRVQDTAKPAASPRLPEKRIS